MHPLAAHTVASTPSIRLVCILHHYGHAQSRRRAGRQPAESKPSLAYTRYAAVSTAVPCVLHIDGGALVVQEGVRGAGAVAVQTVHRRPRLRLRRRRRRRYRRRRFCGPFPRGCSFGCFCCRSSSSRSSGSRRRRYRSSTLALLLARSFRLRLLLSGAGCRRRCCRRRRSRRSRLLAFGGKGKQGTGNGGVL